jgi:hypothetical protein
VPDTTDRGRFPPRIRLEARLLGSSVGVLDMSGGEDGVGHILNLSVRGAWPHGSVAARLLQETERVARLAAWNRVVWELPAEETLPRAWARSQGFSSTDHGLLQKSL